MSMSCNTYKQSFFWLEIFWTPTVGWKGPKNRVCLSFHPPFRLSVTFLGIGSLFFSKTYHVVRAPYVVVCDRARFFGKNPHRVKMTKIGQKWPKNSVFGLFKKIMSLVLSGISVKWKFLRFINTLRKLHAWEKPGPQVIAKNGSRPMRFQYCLTVNFSLID